ncbi:F0F1 ATP synthase subunit A [Candidatus Sumerlaeota bacterium]|nr:F0F1 ATP synthase subunit A [Candidatus Sumerlaeota bacterium]
MEPVHTPQTDQHSAASPTTPAELSHAEALQGDAAAHQGSEAHGGHGLVLGRHISHPPEPPHLIQIWYDMEQEGLIEQYMHDHPGGAKPEVIEQWLAVGEHGELKAKDGERPTAAQALHYGRLDKPLPIVDYLPWENHVYLGLAMVLLIAIVLAATGSFRRDRRMAMRKPSRGQLFIESLVGGIDDFAKGVLGEENGRKYLPFLGTLFCVILVSNLMGLIPGLKPPTASLVITGSLALCTFIVVQATAWARLGPVSYLYHLMGQPKDLIGWCLAPLFLVLEVISDFLAKPLSLALRLFGNMLGKDILFGAFIGMGISFVSAVSHLLNAPDFGAYIGVPLTIPFYALGLLLSAVQALVFALLSTIYIMLVLPHDHEHGHDDHHGHAHGDDHHGHVAPIHEPVPH